jgi:hypothetical protein
VSAAVSAAEAPPVRRQRRIWPWVVSPFAVLALLVAITWFSHSYQTPDITDPDTLSPTGGGRDGSSRLAEMLRAKGVDIQIVDSSQRAAQIMLNEDATVFVPTPDLLTSSFAALAPTLSHQHRIVLVQPGIRSAPFWGFFPNGARWAAGPARPDCGRSFAEAAGVATMAHWRYDADEPTTDCYNHGLVGMRVDNAEVLVVGATDPFRNGRIDERGNAALALGLLTESPTLIWVDVHKKEPVATTGVQLPRPRYEQPERGGDSGIDPAYVAMPPVLWSTLALLAFIAALLAFVRARRLGPPVQEPLPVLVPATETVTGRGRLYARTRAREATLDALRAATIRRIALVLGPPGTTAASPLPSETELVELVATHTGRPAPVVWETLYGGAPADDGRLAQAVAALDVLEQAVMREQPRPGDGQSTEEEQR